MGGIGLEHHRSSENGVKPGYFTKWADGPGSRNLLPHELVHSWNGKFRRGADAWTPDFRTPMRDSLLGVYEGTTQFRTEERRVGKEWCSPFRSRWSASE